MRARAAPDVGELLGRAEAAIDVRRPAEAERAARGALALDPGNETGHALLSHALLLQGRHPDALGAAEDGLGASPASEVLHRIRAVVLRELGRHTDALAAADEAVRLGPDDAQAHLVRSLALQSLRRVAEARTAADRAIALAPEDATIRSQLGDLWTDEDPVRAERHYREALTLDAADPGTLNNLGVALTRQKRHREASLAFRSALLLDPTLQVAKENVRSSVDTLLGGGTLFAVAMIALQGARVAHHYGKAIGPGAMAVAIAALATMVATWIRRRLAARRLAAEEPQLHAIYVALEADRKKGRLKR